MLLSVDGSYVWMFREKKSGHIFKDQAAWPLKMGPISCLEMSVNKYQSMLRNMPEG
jgi:hypothetical protein